MLALLFSAFAQAPAPRLDISSPRLAVDYCTLRQMAEDRASTVPPELLGAVQEMRALDESLPATITLRSGTQTAAGPQDRRVRDLYWSLLDSVVLSQDSVQRLVDGAGPEKIGDLDGPETVRRIGRILRGSQDALQTRYSADLAMMAKQRGYWRDEVEPKLTDIYGQLYDRLGVSGGPESIRVYVVPRLAGKGGITLRTSSGPLVVVGCNRFAKADYAEVLIHETLHALDVAAKEVRLFARLRKELPAADMSAPQAELAIHTLIFMTAAQVIQQCVDPEHKDVGQTHGIYARGMAEMHTKMSEPVSRLWAGTISVDECVSELVAALA